MTTRRRISLLPWTVAANAIALLMLMGATQRPWPAANIATQANGISRPTAELVAAAPSAPPSPPRVIVRRQRIHHIPARVPPPLRAPGSRWPWFSDPGTLRPGKVGPAAAPDPLQDALAAALAAGHGDLPGTGGTVPLVVVGEVVDTPSSRSIVAATTDAEPPGAGWQVVTENDSLWRTSTRTRAWYAEAGRPALWWNAPRRVFWASPVISAAWWAERAEALDLLRAMVADPRLRVN